MLKKILFIFVLASVVATPMYAVPFFESSVKARYEKMLADEEQRLTKNLIPKDWTYIINEVGESATPQCLLSEETNNIEPIDPHIEAIVKKLLAKHNLKSVKLISFPRTGVRRLSTGEIIMGISTQQLEEMCHNDLEIESFILHEIMHIKNKDLTYAFERNRELNHFYEKRADLQSGLVSLEHAKALRDSFKRLSDPGTWSHPSCEERAEYMQQLVQDLEEEQRVQNNTRVATC